MNHNLWFVFRWNTKFEFASPRSRGHRLSQCHNVIQSAVFAAKTQLCETCVFSCFSTGKLLSASRAPCPHFLSKVYRFFIASWIASGVFRFWHLASPYFFVSFSLIFASFALDVTRSVTNIRLGKSERYSITSMHLFSYNRSIQEDTLSWSNPKICNGPSFWVISMIEIQSHSPFTWFVSAVWHWLLQR